MFSGDRTQVIGLAAYRHLFSLAHLIDPNWRIFSSTAQLWRGTEKHATIQKGRGRPGYLRVLGLLLTSTVY